MKRLVSSAAALAAVAIAFVPASTADLTPTLAAPVTASNTRGGFYVGGHAA